MAFKKVAEISIDKLEDRKTGQEKSREYDPIISSFS